MSKFKDYLVNILLKARLTSRLDEVSQALIQLSFVETQEWRLHIHSGQSVTVLKHSHCEKVFPNIYLEYSSPKDVSDVSHPFMVCSKSLALFPLECPIILLKTAINPALAFSLEN